MQSVEEAANTVSERIQRLPVEKIGLHDARGQLSTR
jgi:hypothetical protein